MNIKRETKASIIVLIGILIVVFGIRFLKSGSFFDFDDTYYAKFTNIAGLQESAPVSINGFVVGVVKKITLMTDSSLLVAFTINDFSNLSKTSVANLADDGIIGSKSIQIIPDFDNKNKLKPGDTLETRFSGGLREMISKKLDPVFSEAEHMIDGIDSAFMSFNKIMDSKGQEDMKKIIANFHKTSSSLYKSTESLEQMISENRNNIKTILENSKSISEDLKKITADIKDVGIKQTFKNLKHISEELDSLITKLNNDTGSFGKMINDDVLYDNLNKTLKEIEQLTRDIKLHPKRYFSVLRRKEIPYKQEDSK